jgi:hypothetical protein
MKSVNTCRYALCLSGIDHGSYTFMVFPVLLTLNKLQLTEWIKLFGRIVAYKARKHVTVTA